MNRWDNMPKNGLLAKEQWTQRTFKLFYDILIVTILDDQIKADDGFMGSISKQFHGLMVSAVQM